METFDNFGIPVSAQIINPHAFQSLYPLSRIDDIAIDPRPKALVSPYDKQIHSENQRGLLGAKAGNMKEMSEDYIPRMAESNPDPNDIYRLLQPITLWSAQKIEIEMYDSDRQHMNGIAYISVPLMAIDGGTRLAAYCQYRENLRMQGKRVPTMPVPFTVVHDIDAMQARHLFYIFNTKAVNLQPKDAQMKDATSPIARFFTQEFKDERWSLLQNIDKGNALLFGFARALVGGRKYISNKRITPTGDDYNRNYNKLLQSLDMLNEAKRSFEYRQKDEKDMLFTHIVLGVMGAELHENDANPSVSVKQMHEIINDVNWIRGTHWVGCGLNEKRGATNKFSLSGATGAAVGLAREALFDTTSPFYRRIRVRSF